MSNSIELIDELLPGAFLLKSPRFEDERGLFVKTYHENQLNIHGIHFDMREEFYSISKNGVIRGMHFQIPPFDHEKLVSCLSGKVLDVLLDLRSGPGYGRFTTVTLSGDSDLSIYIPSGIAHGFMSQSDHSLMIYKTSTVHQPLADFGIRWDSFGFDWGLVNPVLSERDINHSSFEKFESPF